MRRVLATQGKVDAPLVSVLVSNFNYGRYVREAVTSVLSQTYERLEVIVCDDGSSDDSLKVLERLAADDPRVTLIAQANGGQSAALNVAAGKATGEVLCFLDADDVFLPNKVAAVVEGLRTSGAGLFLHRVNAIDEGGKVLQPLPLSAQFEEGWIRDKVLRRGGRYPVVPTSAIAIAADLRDRVFPLPETLRRASDGFVFTLAPLLAPVAASPEILALYRVHGTNVGGSIAVTEKTTSKTIENLEQVGDAVNERLALLGDPARIHVARNLLWRQQRLHEAMLGDARRNALAPMTLGFLGAVLRDDLLRLSTRVVYLSVYPLALLMPRRGRARWLSLAFGLNPVKRLAAKVLRFR